MFRLMRDITSKISSDDTVPGWVVFFVEFLFNVGSDVFLNVVLLEGLCGAVDGVLLHVLGHVGVLDNSFSLRHSCCKKSKVSNGLLSPRHCFREVKSLYF